MAVRDAVTKFKRVSRANVPKTDTSDEEKGTVMDDEKASSISSGDSISTPPMTSVFSWRHINYVVPIPGKPDRQILVDVSGYVAPGKLTALMGATGAGKTSLLNALSMRTDVGVVTGNRFINGQPLPADFQSQTYIFPFKFCVGLQLILECIAPIANKWIHTLHFPLFGRHCYFLRSFVNHHLFLSRKRKHSELFFL